MRTYLIAALVMAFSSWNAVSAAKSKSKSNPHLEITTTLGAFTIELLPAEAPNTVKNFVALSLGTRLFVDYKSKRKMKRPFYDGLTFHRVVAGALVQGGCPVGDGSGTPGYRIPDEINATALGLDKAPILGADGRPDPRLEIRTEDDFYEKIVDPLLKVMGVTDQATFRAKKDAIDRKIKQLTVQQAYENLGYRYTTKHTTRPIVRGVLAMASSGPNTSGSQFFIALGAFPNLDGKHTPFARVVKGMKVVERLAALPVDKRSRPTVVPRILSVHKVKRPRP